MIESVQNLRRRVSAAQGAECRSQRLNPSGALLGNIERLVDIARHRDDHIWSSKMLFDGKNLVIYAGVVVEIIIQDPLVITLALLVAGVVASHLLFRRYPLGRAIVRVVFLILLTLALLYADIVPYRPLEPTGVPIRDVVVAVLKMAWWLRAAWFLVGFIRAFIIVEQRPHEGRLVQDLLAGLVYLTALFAIVAYVLDLPVQGLLATSGVIAIILGLASQSTLGDVFSGIVLSFSRPYRAGDWVSIDGTTEGRVIEMNWRATHILTGRRDLAILPNSTIAKSKIVNVSAPSGIHGASVTVAIDDTVPPAVDIEILHEAIINCLAIVTTPAPSVTVDAISGSAIEFGITFFTADFAASQKAQRVVGPYLPASYSSGHQTRCRRQRDGATAR